VSRLTREIPNFRGEKFTFVLFSAHNERAEIAALGTAKIGGVWGVWEREARERAEPPALMEGSVCFHDYSYK